jgi:4-amino-4-deoxy-L-arabinose transferase-like glycosyltransferase
MTIDRSATTATPAVSTRRRWHSWVLDSLFVLVLLGALASRLQLAERLPLIHDEENTSIPLSRLISFEAGKRNLPIRAVNHPALPAYFVKLSSTLFGETALGYRTVHVLSSLVTIALVGLLARRAYGSQAALAAAILLAFNEYFLNISARATAHGPYLMFATVALFAFSRFLVSHRRAALYAAGLALGLGFYCKEHVVLLLPIFLGTLLVARERSWLRTPHPYLAALVFAIVIAPDVAWNAAARADVNRVTYGQRDAPQATYASHLKRIGGVGLSLYPLVFYGHDATMAAYRAATGEEMDDNTPEYLSMNLAFGVVLVASVVFATVRPASGDPLQPFLLIAFWTVFAVFTLIKRGDSPGLDPVSWIWVDVTMIPAAVMAGACVTRLRGLSRLGVWLVIIAAATCAVWSTVVPTIR